METPQTPPGNQSTNHQLFTPPTPRYAPIDEPDRFPYKASFGHGTGSRHKDNKIPLLSSHIRSKSGTGSIGSGSSATDLSTSLIPITPAQTPANRQKDLDYIQGQRCHSSGRILFPGNITAVGSGRSCHRVTPTRPSKHVSGRNGSEKSLESNTDNIDQIETVVSGSINDPFDSKPVVPDVSHASSSLAHSLSSHTKHPYDPIDTNVPGAWYSFRGKKVFRPFDDNNETDDIKPRRLFVKEQEALHKIHEGKDIKSNRKSHEISSLHQNPRSSHRNHPHGHKDSISSEDSTDKESDGESSKHPVYSKARSNQHPFFYR